MTTQFDEVRNSIMKAISDLLNEKEYDVLVTGSQELCIPIVGDEGDEGYLVMTFKVPKGSRDGEAYDGYSMAEDYKMKLEAKAEKDRAKAEEKAKKKARDEKLRQSKAEAKAKREGEK